MWEFVAFSFVSNDVSCGHTNNVLYVLFRECGEYDSALCDLSEALRLSPPGGNSRDLLRFAAKVREEAKERERTNNNSDRKGEDGVSFENSEKWFRANVVFFSIQGQTQSPASLPGGGGRKVFFRRRRGRIQLEGKRS